MNYRNWFSKEQITNNDDFCFKSPITRSDHFRLVLTQFGSPCWQHVIYELLFWVSRYGEGLIRGSSYYLPLSYIKTTKLSQSWAITLR